MNDCIQRPAACDVMDGDQDDRSLPFSLYNTGAAPVRLTTLHMTGGFWVPRSAVVRGARLIHAMSNYTVLGPKDALALAPDEVSTFSISDLNDGLSGQAMARIRPMWSQRRHHSYPRRTAAGTQSGHGPP